MTSTHPTYVFGHMQPGRLRAGFAGWLKKRHPHLTNEQLAGIVTAITQAPHSVVGDMKLAAEFQAYVEEMRGT
jgi:hypothetical protein